MASSRITGTNENISTYGDGTRNYTSLATWESATDNDLVTATTSEVLECYADAASFADAVTLSDATTSALYFRIIRPADGEGHDGTPNTGVVFTGTSTIFNLSEGYASVYDIAASFTANSASDLAAFNGSSTGDPNKRIIGCIAFDCTNAGAGAASGFLASSDQCYIANCFALRIENAGCLSNGGTTNFFYNCTAIDCDQGFRNTGGTTTVFKNCLGHSNTTADFSNSGTTTGSTNNASSDATALGTVTYISQTFTFVDAANDDFHLHRNDLGAKFRGTNLSADATFAFDDDIDGDTITNWSIGFHAEETQQSARRTGDNENISTYAASGADYTSLAVWEAATDNDLVTGEVTEVLECAAGTYNDTVALAGATTDGRYFRIIRAASGAVHRGNAGTGVLFSRATGNSVIAIQENNACLQDIEVALATNSASGTGALMFTSGNNAQIVGALVSASTNAGTGSGNGINVASGVTNFVVALCSVRGAKSVGFTSAGTGTGVVYNSHATGNGTLGFNTGASGTVLAKNDLAHGNTGNEFSANWATGTTTNAADDANAPGTSARNSQTFTFVNSGTGNYHLSASDAGAKGFGTNMTTDPFFNFNDDIDNMTVSTWSIGFDSDPDHAGGKAGDIRLTSKVHGVLT